MERVRSSGLSNIVPCFRGAHRSRRSSHETTENIFSFCREENLLAAMKGGSMTRTNALPRLKNVVFCISISLSMLFLMYRRDISGAFIHRDIPQVRSLETFDQQQEVGIAIGTVVRGDEWMNPESEKKKAVLVSLFSLSQQLGDENIVLLADTQSACKTLPTYLARARCNGLEHCIHSVYGSPTMDCIFSTLWSLAKHDIVGFINGDILVFDSFVQSIVSCANNYEHFVMVGRRHLSDVAMSIPATIREWAELETHTKSLKLDGGAAIDFFVTRRTEVSVFKDFPPFIVGVYRWDNYLLLRFFRDLRTVVIDATGVAPVMHQVFNEVENHESRPAASYNHELVTEYSGNDWTCGTIDNSNIILLNITEGNHDVKVGTGNYSC